MYICFKDPSNEYERFIERHCLREKKKSVFKSKKELVDNAIRDWREIKKDKSKVANFLKLLPGEKDLER